MSSAHLKTGSHLQIPARPLTQKTNNWHSSNHFHLLLNSHLLPLSLSIPKTLIPLSISNYKAMSLETSVDRRKQPLTPIAGNGNANANGNGNGVVAEDNKLRLRVRANENHKAESYEDLQLQLEFSPLLFSSLEQYLPFNMLHVSRELKLQYMRHILLRYSPEGERARVILLLLFFSITAFLLLFGC